MPATLQDLGKNLSLVDAKAYLNEAESKEAIEWAIKREKQRYAFSMQDKGLHPMEIAKRLAEKDFLQAIDVENVIVMAAQRKKWAEEEAIERAENKSKEIEAMKALVAMCNANYFFSLIKKYFYREYGQFLHNETNADYIKALCFFLSNDERFETELGYSFKKGLMINGSAGVGKTKTIEAVKNNELKPISIFSMIEITDAVRNRGTIELNTDKYILLDDVGSESTPVKYFGTEINWFKDFVESYYLRNKVYNRLIITTNCDGEEIEKKYGYRVRSRIREMFNQIKVTGNDLRK